MALESSRRINFSLFVKMPRFSQPYPLTQGPASHRYRFSSRAGCSSRSLFAARCHALCSMTPIMCAPVRMAIRQELPR
jgi:hypothetical protein